MEILLHGQIKGTNILVCTIFLLVVINLVGSSDARKRRFIDYGVIREDGSTRKYYCNARRTWSCLGRTKQPYVRGCEPEDRCRGAIRYLNWAPANTWSCNSSWSWSSRYSSWWSWLWHEETEGNYSLWDSCNSIAHGAYDYGRDKKSFKPNLLPKGDDAKIHHKD